MDLCLALGHKSITSLRHHIPASEYPLWIAYAELYGLPFTRLEHTTALAGSAVCHSFGCKVKASDLIPDRTEREPMSYDQWANIFGAWAKGHNKRLERRQAEAAINEAATAK